MKVFDESSFENHALIQSNTLNVEGYNFVERKIVNVNQIKFDPSDNSIARKQKQKEVKKKVDHLKRFGWQLGEMGLIVEECSEKVNEEGVLQKNYILRARFHTHSAFMELNSTTVPIDIYEYDESVSRKIAIRNIHTQENNQNLKPVYHMTREDWVEDIKDRVEIYMDGDVHGLPNTTSKFTEYLEKNCALPESDRKWIVNQCRQKLNSKTSFIDYTTAQADSWVMKNLNHTVKGQIDPNTSRAGYSVYDSSTSIGNAVNNSLNKVLKTGSESSFFARVEGGLNKNLHTAREGFVKTLFNNLEMYKWVFEQGIKFANETQNKSITMKEFYGKMPFKITGFIPQDINRNLESENEAVDAENIIEDFFNNFNKKTP